MKAEDFLLEETQEEKVIKNLKTGIDSVKVVCHRLLKMALDSYRRTNEDNPSPTAAGKAIAYVMAFKLVSRAIGMDTSMHDKGIAFFLEKLGAVALKVEEARNKVIIEHRRDPEGLVIEKEKLEIRKVEEVRRQDEIKIKEAPPPSEVVLANRMVEDVARGLRALGYKGADAQKRATQVYRPDVPLEELIMEACRLPD